MLSPTDEALGEYNLVLTDKWSPELMPQGQTDEPPSRWRAGLRTLGCIFFLWNIPMILVCATRLVERGWGGSDASVLAIILSSAFIWYLWIPLTPPILWMVRRFPLSVSPRPTVLLGHVLVMALLANVYVLLAVVLGSWIGEVMTSGRSFGAMYMQVLSFGFPLAFFAYFGIVAWRVSTQASRELRESTLALARTEAELAQTRLHHLQARLHPHFLFNALHSVASLVRRSDRERALTMIARLSDLLRRLLKQDENATLPLRDELDLIEDYLGIEQERLGDRLCFDMDIDEACLEWPVPTLVLQPVVENAIKHGIAKVTDPCRLGIRGRIDEDVLRLEVLNEGAPLLIPREGFGLKNTRARLARMYGERASIRLGTEEGVTRAVILIPRNHGDPLS